MDTESKHRRLLSSTISFSSRILLHAVGRTPNSFTARELRSLAWARCHHTQVALQEIQRHEANWRPCTFEGVTFQQKLVMKVTTRIWKLWGSRDGDCSVLHFWNVTPWGLLADRGVVPSHLFPYLNMLPSQNFTLLHWIWRQYAAPKIC
jgi:hypothetical protein